MNKKIKTTSQTSEFTSKIKLPPINFVQQITKIVTYHLSTCITISII